MNSSRSSAALLALLMALHAVLPAAAQDPSERPRYAPYDGKGNNAANPTWNAVGAVMLRYPVSETGYPVPSGEIMAGPSRPSPRAISVAVTNSPYFKTLDPGRATNLVSVVGQYATTDISKSLDSTSTNDNSSQPIPVPPGDPWMSNFTESNGTTAVSPYGTRRSLPFKRSQFVIDAAGVRQQNNSVTGFLDASVVYGTSAGAARKLRTGSGGLLRDDGSRGLPFNEDPALAAEGGGPTAKLFNMSNVAKAVPASRLR
ncbi:hypothetical protein OEZ85_003838 [Tetradesmus obliquus]|uniref:Uncharacterized protein n=1 Tax=Tetradesmus obliquus TaxID=3088 RepID=A0ABY8UEX3_TETOB|nr:hypothetical protein OEZ85_003838 [Tetradesmus obliquus]